MVEIENVLLDLSEYFKRAVETCEPIKSLDVQMDEAFGPDLQWTPEQLKAFKTASA